ncbi:hypothetical protein MY04_4274 [Flammeovirga sp. MY04]|uniref:hypothetical protein n=1 Tax=Flammeovirga sp. MY04 TaxID=1191459 RepID=UPI00080633F3|nr:hypothetical protein [Flammeovirga sp. MY04]ANQ51616.1 hypothetical protein MY04_4274 [Flammeovirga sp. MY04]
MKLNFTLFFLYLLLSNMCCIHAQSTFDYQFDRNTSQWTSDQENIWAIQSDPANTKDALKITAFSKPKYKYIYSIETASTILLVRTAKKGDQNIIIGSDYDGQLMGMDYNGNILWKNPLSGFMNNDIWCEDITGNGNDEILCANADGSLFCVDTDGKTLWTFKKTEVPLFSVSVVNYEGKKYAVTGGFELSLFYIDHEGNLIKEIKNSSYSIDKAWGSGDIPQGNKHVNNHIKKFYDQYNDEKLLVQSAFNGNAADGTIYLFEPFADQPYEIIDPEMRKPVGGLQVVNMDGKIQVMMGTSTSVTDSQLMVYDLSDKTYNQIYFPDYGKEFDRFGYRIVAPDVLDYKGEKKYMTLFGSRIFLFSKDFWENGEKEILANSYAFNDFYQDRTSNKLILASAQSGGSCIHVIDLSNDEWADEFEEFVPSGNIKKLINNTSKVREQVLAFQRPNYERVPLETFFMSDTKDDITAPYIDAMNSNSYGAQFYANIHMPKVENWDRSEMENETYKNKRDGRKNYSLTQQEVLDKLTPYYSEGVGINSWGGHGNDPYYYSVETKKKLLDASNGKRMNLIYPELESTTDEFSFVLTDLLLPMADYGRDKNLTIYLRNKHLFWSGIVHKPIWERVLNGEYAEVFVPSMEETTDKTMELSVASRMGLWASGVFDNWGARSARDNPSFLRLRQKSHQMLPNHFLRQMVYNISCGARYLNNFAVDQEYMSVLWEMVERGVIFVPKREEIVSFSPVHLSIVNPTDNYIKDGNKVKWLTWFDETYDENSDKLFDRLNGSWPASPTNPWDFSNFAAGVKDRRLHFLPNYQNGIVMITPPQNEHFVPNELPRGYLKNHLHPLYKDILTEYISDGEYFYSADGNNAYKASSYSELMKEELEEKAKLIPVTVEGEVAWVAAQSAPKHIRLTLIDGGYINPSDKVAVLRFGSVTPVKITDVLSGQSISISEEATEVDIPCGTFRFLDVELQNEL